MSIEENDPDTLQLLDEADRDWVKQWRKAASKQITPKNDLQCVVPQLEKTSQSSSKAKAII